MKQSPHFLSPVEIMRNFLLGVLWFLLMMTSGFADDFSQANQQYQAGDFAGAVTGYERTLATDGGSAAVFYNLGNSYQQLKQYGKAVLAYERARVIAPRDSNLLENLAMARQAIHLPPETAFHPWLDAALHYLSRNEWSWCMVGSALLISGLFLLDGVLKLPRGWPRLTAYLLSGAAGIGIITSASALYLRRAEDSCGIVLTEAASIRLSPFEKAEAIGNISQGRAIQLGAETLNFYDVEVPGVGLRGWLSNKDVEKITQKYAQDGD
jgi:tetratricopeptide (TPR) repeat protein